jgi:short-subunit dehydrogenase
MSTANTTSNASRPVALVTGASGGIGLELARQAARNGYDVVLVARSAEKLEALGLEVAQTYGVDVHVVAADLARPGAAAEVFARTEALGLEIDLLVNNAGYGLYGAFVESDLDRELEMIQLNVSTLTALTKRYARRMVTRGRGRILNVASTAAFQPGPLMAVYYATKAYVLSFSEALANELDGTGVTVTAVCPGPTKSGFQATANMEGSKLVSGKRLPGAEEVAVAGFAAAMRGARVYVPGFMNRALASATRFMPRRAVTSFVRKAQERSHAQA